MKAIIFTLEFFSVYLGCVALGFCLREIVLRMTGGKE